LTRILLLLAVAAALVAPAAASAHPLGNFTVNRFARAEVAGDRLYVRYVLDLAEIPAYQARQEGVNPRVYGYRIAGNLHVTLNRRRVLLVPVRHALAYPQGVAGLRTMRLEVILRGPHVTQSSAVGIRDENYAGRIGWHELVVGARTRSASDELRAYPKSLLSSPLAVNSAAGTLKPDDNTAVPRLSSGSSLEAADRVADGGFTRLIGNRHLSLLVVLGSLAAALFWGAAHALSPGHGKTIVTAYLVGRRGTPKDAALLGGIVTVSHTIGVFALGLVTLALSQWIVPDRLYPWLNAVAGVFVVAIGVAVLRSRVRDWLHERSHRRAHRSGDHHHSHEHEHEPGSGLKGLLAVGVSGGILPCPSALVVLLAAISLHRLAFGLLLIVAFSLGLALSITAVGLIAVLARSTFARRNFDGLLFRVLPAASAVVIVAAGLLMTLHALPQVR
jgi:ABC-type nickel/cobalt efflux system permease component RcnA